MGYDVHKLVPFGGGGTRADMGQTRGAQSGEADRHAVWLAEHNLEPKMSPYDPTAMLDEIQRLVPGYDISRLGLLSGQDEHTQLVQIAGAHRHGTSGIGAAVKRHTVHFGHAGPLFPQRLNTVMERYRTSRLIWRFRQTTTRSARQGS